MKNHAHARVIRESHHGRWSTGPHRLNEFLNTFLKKQWVYDAFLLSQLIHLFFKLSWRLVKHLIQSGPNIAFWCPGMRKQSLHTPSMQSVMITNCVIRSMGSIPLASSWKIMALTVTTIIAAVKKGVISRDVRIITQKSASPWFPKSSSAKQGPQIPARTKPP